MVTFLSGVPRSFGQREAERKSWRDKYREVRYKLMECHLVMMAEYGVRVLYDTYDIHSSHCQQERKVLGQGRIPGEPVTPDFEVQ